MTRNQNYDNGASSSKKRPTTCAPWSDLDHDLLYIVMLKLGVIKFLSFRGVCKSWRLLACSHEKKFMASMPPMHMSISCGTHEKTCHLEDFEGRKFKTILPSFYGGACVGVTCGYLIFFKKSTRDFWLVNPITRKQLHFPDFPMVYNLVTVGSRVFLVVSPSTSGLVFVVYYMNKIWFSVVGKGTWNCVPHDNRIFDLCAFKGKIYILTYGSDNPYQLCELRLGPQPQLTLLKIKRPDYFVSRLASSAEKLYAIYWRSKVPISLYGLDLGEMKWVKASEKTLEEYAFFRSDMNYDVVAVKPESWADPRSRSHGRFALSPHSDNNGRIRCFTEEMWYFPHEYMNVDRIDEESTYLV